MRDHVPVALNAMFAERAHKSMDSMGLVTVPSSGRDCETTVTVLKLITRAVYDSENE